jgi:hypothetical protein
MGMLDLSLDPSAAAVRDDGRESAGETPFLSELDLVEFANNILRNCSLFIFAASKA